VEDYEDVLGELYELEDRPSPAEIASLMAPVLVEPRPQPRYYVLDDILAEVG